MGEEPSPRILSERAAKKAELAELIRPILDEQAKKRELPETMVPSPEVVVDRIINLNYSENGKAGNGTSPTAREVECLNNWLQTRIKSLKKVCTGPMI